MTFQIGLVGKDGVLLASDTLHTQVAPTRSTFNSPKISHDTRTQITHCWSGDELGQLFSDVMRNRLPTAEERATEHAFSDYLRLRADNAIEVANAIRRADQPTSLRSSSVMLAVPTPVNGTTMSLWRLDLSSDGRCPCPHNVIDKTCCGDESSPALLFTERYFPQDERVPIRDLVSLAAHTVFMASRFNNWVAGLQIVLCRPPGNIENISGDEIARLLARSSSLDQEIGKQLHR